MIETTLPLLPELWATLPALVRAPLFEEWATPRLEYAALRAQSAALLRAGTLLRSPPGPVLYDFRRAPSSEPPHAPMHQEARPSRWKRGGRHGYCGAFRGLVPVEQVDEIVAVVQEHCQYC